MRAVFAFCIHYVRILPCKAVERFYNDDYKNFYLRKGLGLDKTEKKKTLC